MTLKKLKAITKEYAKLMLLSDWHLDVILSDKEVGDENAAAMVSFSHIYKHGTITFYKSAFKSPNDVHHIVIHELCHLLTEPLYISCIDFLNGKHRSRHDIEDQREMMTEHIAKVASSLISKRRKGR